MIKREELTSPTSCMSRAADDEMTFVLLGRDAAAPVAIRAWITERIRLGKNTADDPQIVEAEGAARMIETSHQMSRLFRPESSLEEKVGILTSGIFDRAENPFPE